MTTLNYELLEALMDVDSVFTNSMKKLGGGGFFVFFIPDNIASH